MRNDSLRRVFLSADPKVNSDFKPDVRSLSFSVDLTGDGMLVPEANIVRQDFSLQNTATLPINGAPAFLAIMRLLTAANSTAGLWASPFNDKLRVLRTLALVQVQAHQKIQPYQKLRYDVGLPYGVGIFHGELKQQNRPFYRPGLLDFVARFDRSSEE